jgi:hypothetical protein
LVTGNDEEEGTKDPMVAEAAEANVEGRRGGKDELFVCLKSSKIEIFHRFFKF